MVSREDENIFAQIVDRARTLDPVNTRKWFDQLALLKLDGGSLQIGCPDDVTVSFLSDNCQNTFTRAAGQVTGHLVSVNFELSNHRPVEHRQPGYRGLKLHPDYVFENFVVGPSNRLAHASCVAVSQSPGNTYNPLYLYGNSGLGKTHLLQAVCNETLRRNPDTTIEFLSCEDFVNRFIRAIEEGNLATFQHQFRSVDLLVIDDIQFLSDREQSQEEFFHTFNALYNSGRQIILSSDSQPSDIPSLEERLISRFSWGLVARIDPPSYETRVAIIQKKAHLRGLEINEDIAEYIARKVHTNIRELEGALTTLYAVATTTSSEVSLDMARNALEGQIEAAVKHISITDIIQVITEHFNVRLADLQSKRRSQSITVPRQICMYLARHLTRHSLEEIGGHLGGRDHTTVMHACSKIANSLNQDPQLHAAITELEKKITELRRA